MRHTRRSHRRRGRLVFHLMATSGDFSRPTVGSRARLLLLPLLFLKWPLTPRAFWTIESRVVKLPVAFCKCWKLTCRCEGQRGREWKRQGKVCQVPFLFGFSLLCFALLVCLLNFSWITIQPFRVAVWLLKYLKSCSELLWEKRDRPREQEAEEMRVLFCMIIKLSET